MVVGASAHHPLLTYLPLLMFFIPQMWSDFQGRQPGPIMCKSAGEYSVFFISKVKIRNSLSTTHLHLIFEDICVFGAEAWIPNVNDTCNTDVQQANVEGNTQSAMLKSNTQE